MSVDNSTPSESDPADYGFHATLTREWIPPAESERIARPRTVKEMVWRFVSHRIIDLRKWQLAQKNLA